MADIAPELLARVPDADLVELYESIKDGAKTPGESIGFGPEALVSIERMALGYYRGQRFAQAAVLYTFILRMDQRHGAAWRGLAACCQAGKLFAIAIRCYEAAIDCDASDVVSKVFLAECLCQGGRLDEGLARLKQIVTEGTSETRYRPYLTRAQAILSAKGKLPPKLVLMREGKKIVADAAELLAEDESREITAEDIKNNPELAPLFEEVKKLVGDGRLTLAQVGGFTQNELDGAYGCACEYAQMGRVTEAMQIAGYLALVDPYNGRYFQLTAICWQRMKQYQTADHFYGLALRFDENNPRTLCYQGECQLMLGKIDSGVELLKASIAAAGSNKDHADIAKRAHALLTQLKR